MSDFRKLVENIMVNGKISNRHIGPVQPPQPWSLAALMQGEPITEAGEILVEHPTLGPGSIVEIDNDGSTAIVEWDRLGSWTKNSEHITLEEAKRIVVVDSPKYSHEHMSEDTNMSNIDLTGDDLQALFESENYLNVPTPADSILTKQSEFKSDSESQPLSGLDGNGGANDDPHEEGSSPSDAPDTPSVASMDEPSRKAKIAKGGGGSGSNQHKKTSTKSSSDEEDNSESEEEKMKNESFTFEEADIEGLDEMNHMDEGDYMEHDMAAGEIAVTQEFLKKLMGAAVSAGLDDSKIDMIVDCVADCCGEDRTLDVADIGEVMSNLKGKVDGGDDAMDGDDGMEPAGDEFEGPEDDAELMGDMDDDMEECGDEMMDEGSEESRAKGRMRQQNKRMDKTRQHADGGSKPKYRKPKAAKPVEEGELPDALKKHKIEKGSDADGDGKKNEDKKDVKESRQPVKEAWLMSIPNVGNRREKAKTAGMTDEEIEMMEIRRLAGM